MANVGITGGEDLIAALREFPVKLEVQVMASALRGGAKVIQSAAIDNVPVDSGDLRNSIKIRRKTNKKTGFINFRLSAGDKKAWYAHIIEFGAKPHIIRASKKKSLLLSTFLREIVHHPGVKVPNKGFMRTAFDQSATESIAEVARLTKKGIARLELRRSKGQI